MNIQGLQKLTLLDYPGKVACSVFTGGCNFRCPFCHNASLVREQYLPEPQWTVETLLAFLEKRKGILDGVCVTGGEPLLQEDIKPLLQAIKCLGYDIKLDTNGSLPQRMIPLIEAHVVDYIAMDIKNALPWYAETIGLPRYDTTPVEESVAYLLKGHIPYEFRTTVVRGFHDFPRLQAIADWIKGAPKYYLQQFVDSGDLLGEGCQGFDSHTIKAFAQQLGDGVDVRGI